MQSNPLFGEHKESIMAEKKAILVLADSLDLNASGDTLDALRKRPLCCLMRIVPDWPLWRKSWAR